MASPEQPPRILVVDDSPAMRVAISDLLKDAGLEVTDEASNGLQAVAMVVELQPDIVIMDVRLRCWQSTSSSSGTR